MANAPADIYGTQGGTPTVKNEVSGEEGGTPIRTQANPEDYGAGFDAAVGDQSGKFVEIANDTIARDGVTAASKKLSDLEFQYNQQKGMNAVGALKTFQAGAGALMESTASSMSPAAGSMFRNQFAPEVDRSIFRSGSYAADQLEVAQTASLDASLKSKVNNMAMNIADPNSRQANISLIRDDAIQSAHIKGLDPAAADSLISQYVGDAYAGGIRQLTASDPDKATALFNEALNGKFIANRNGQNVSVPYLDAAHRAQISSEMNSEFKQQEGQQLMAARSYAAAGASYDVNGLSKAMKNAGKTPDEIKAELGRLDQVRSNFGAVDNQYKIGKTFADNEARATNGLPIQTVDENAIRAAYPREPDKAQDIINHQNDLQHVAGFVGSFPSKSVSQIYQDLDSFKPSAAPTANGNSASGINFIQSHEGGYVSNDSGKGPTNFGINAESNPGVDVANLTKEGAAKIIHDKYAMGVGADKMSPAMAAVATDSAVNMGIDKTNTLIAQAGNDPQKLIDLRRAEYQRLATANPEKYGQSLQGWNKRLDDLQKELPNITPSQSGYAEQSNMYKMMSNAADAYKDNLYKDPSGTLVSKDPLLTGMLNDGLKDPKQLGKFIDASLSRQESVGVPEGLKSALPQNVSISMANSIAADPASAPDVFNKIQQQTGDHWPQVYHSLVTQGGLPPVYQSIAELGGHPDTASDAKLLATISGEDTKGKTYKDLLGDKTITDFKTTIQGDQKWTQLRDSLANGGATPQQVEGVYSSIEALAAAKQFYNKDPNAAQNALDSFDKHNRYMPDGGARVPEELFSRTQSNAKYVMDNIDKFAHESTPYSTGFHGQIKPQDYYSWLQGSHSWVNTASGDGMLLRDPNNQVVLGKNGKPLIIQFSAPNVVPSIPHGTDTEGSDLLKTIGK